MAELQATLTAAAELQATLGAGRINVNDYTLAVEDVENGVKLTLTRGSRTETVFIPDYSEAENEREKSEDERMEAEDARVAAELLRIGAEEKRIAAETERINAETERSEAESERKTSEAERNGSETARSEAEAIRASAEGKREADCAAAVQNANGAAANAQSIADTVQAKLDAGELKGDDGYSPTATVSKSGTTTTVTVTDKNGTTTAEVLDGSDASVTKDNVVAALGYTPAEKEGNYELIGTYNTGEEDIGTFNITEEANGNPLRLKAGLAIIRAPSTLTTDKPSSSYWEVEADGYSKVVMYQWISGIYKAKYPTYTQVAIINGNLCRAMWTTEGSGGADVCKTLFRLLPSTECVCTKFWLYSGQLIPANTTITLYGIRA